MNIEDLLPKATYSRDDDVSAFHLDRSFSESIDFVAIDFETATFDRNSICEVGVSRVSNGEVVENKSWLIQPPGNRYCEFNICIHGITPDDTRNSPTLKDAWGDILPYLEGKVVVAHNTAFDMYVLRDSLLEEDIPFPNFAFFCSCRLSKKVVDCYSYTLPTVCEALGVDFGLHHRAQSDAEGCARVFLECVKRSGSVSFSELQEKYNFRCGRFSDKYFRPQLANHGSHRSGYNYDVKNIVGDPDKLDEGNYFYGKEVCFTGKCQYAVRKQLLQMVADVGGVPVDSVTKHTDVLVVGQQDYRVVGEDGMSSKQEKAIKLKDQGHDIEIISESDFLSNI